MCFPGRPLPSEMFQHSAKRKAESRAVPYQLLADNLCDNYFSFWNRSLASAKLTSNSDHSSVQEPSTFFKANLRFRTPISNCFENKQLSSSLKTCIFNMSDCLQNSNYFQYTVDSKDIENVEELLRKYPTMSVGSWAPCDCAPRQTLAIVVPYRNRLQHLHVFLNNIIPFLQFQRQAFTIFIVEQTQQVLFNRAALFNAAYREIQKLETSYDGVIIHDVDSIPENLCTLYYAGSNPHHFSVFRSKLDYELTYDKYIGGILALDMQTIESVNGMSNMYFGWGGEDDNLYGRLFQIQNKSLTRFDNCLGRVLTLGHDGNKHMPGRTSPKASQS